MIFFPLSLFHPLNVRTKQGYDLKDHWTGGQRESQGDGRGEGDLKTGLPRL